MNETTLPAIAARLADLSRQLDAATTDAYTLDEKAVRAKHAYEIEFSKAFLRSEGAMDVRKHLAVVATGSLKLDAEIAEQVLRANRGRISTLKMQIETGRSLSAALRAEVSLAGSGITP